MSMESLRFWKPIKCSPKVLPPLGRFLWVSLWILTLLSSLGVTPSWGVGRTYTLDADFDEGTLVNVNHDAPNNDQLQLNQVTTPFPFVNIACSARGTIVRIDVNNGTILGEYLTAPGGMGRDPSRTTVDQFGNVWVSNRGEFGQSGGQPKGSITRIGLIIGGTRVNADGTPNPVGQFLAPPFEYSTVTDRDGDGLIKTSLGLGNYLPWTNAGGADTDGGVSTAEDECIINYTRVAGTGTRTVAIDQNNDVWTGGCGDLDHEKISGVTGQPIPSTQFNMGCGGYGGLIDGNGMLWSSRCGSGLLRYDPATNSGACLGNGCGDYGLGIDPQSGNIWHTTLSSGVVCVLDPAGNCLGCYPHGFANAQGVVVDGVGNVWVAHSLYGATVGHLRTDGTYVGNVALPGGNGPTGVAVDANGKVWVACINSNNALRIDPSAGSIGGGGFTIGAVDLVVSLGPGAGPYNYSDMTGFVAIGSTAPQGTWDVVFDGTALGQEWGKASWTSSEPAGTSVVVEVRAADLVTDLPSQPFMPVVNGVPFSGLFGRYIEIQTTLARDPAVQDTPILYDLTIESVGCEIFICPLTQGFWKNHPEDWPEDAVPMTLGTVNQYTQAQLLAIFAMPPRGDASLILAHQLIAAKLNVANCADPEPIEATIDAADALIGARAIPIVPVIRPSSPEGQQMVQLAAMLDAYNKGLLTPDCQQIAPERLAEVVPAVWDGEALGPADFVEVFGTYLLADHTYRFDLVNQIGGYDLTLSVYDPEAEIHTFEHAALVQNAEGAGRSEWGSLQATVSGWHVVVISKASDGDFLQDSGYLLHVLPTASAVVEERNLPDLALEQNAPNPFRPATIIRYVVPSGGAMIRLEVYNPAGQKVRTLVDEERPAGSYKVTWDGTDDGGHTVAAGVYAYRLLAGTHVRTMKMVLMR